MCIRRRLWFTSMPRISIVVAAGVVGDDLRAVEAHRLLVEQGAVELGRVVALEPGDLERGHRHRRRVRLREAEGSEGQDLLEDGRRATCGIDAVRRGARRGTRRAGFSISSRERLRLIARRNWSACRLLKPATAIAAWITCSWKTNTPFVSSRTGSSEGWS